MSRNVIVIGGVALGPKAASRLKRLDPTANVTMIDENINISFGGCGIPYYVSGEINSLDALRSTTYGTVRTPEYFEHKGVHTLNQTRVTAIDRASKTVTAKNLVTGEEKALPYDRLIIATGSTPKVPPVEGRDLKNVGGANNLEDADALRKACASGSVQNAVVIGAGFIGMEIAVALADMWDIKTSVVEFMPQAMPGVMSASLSDMVRHDLEEHNVDVYTGEKVQRLEGENGVVARVVTDKRTLDADLVIFATGFAPNTALARAAGLDLEERTGAILVNANGERFIDEVGTRDVVSAAEIAQPGSYSWLVVDQAMADASSVIQGYIKKGYTAEGATYEELAKAIGVDEATFAETMNNWNQCVADKADAEFGRTSFANPLDTAPYYAIKVTAGVHHTMGGLTINTNTEVLDTNGNVIPGLFAAGEITGGVHGANRLGGNAVADFTVFGRIAGAAASKYAA